MRNHHRFQRDVNSRSLLYIKLFVVLLHHASTSVSSHQTRVQTMIDTIVVYLQPSVYHMTENTTLNLIGCVSNAMRRNDLMGKF